MNCKFHKVDELEIIMLRIFVSNVTSGGISLGYLAGNTLV